MIGGANNSGNSLGPVVGLTLVAALVGSILVLNGRLETRRPGQQAVVFETDANEEQVPARLWQDPLHAIQVHWDGLVSEPSSKQVPADFPRSIERMPTVFQPKRSRTSPKGKESRRGLRLLVMMPGAPYAEDRENRRRQRHAVVSALTEADYVPVDAGRLGYFRAARFNRARPVPQSNPVGKQNEMLIGFELYEPALEQERDEESDGGDEPVLESVVVLWLNADDFGTCTLERVSALAVSLDGDEQKPSKETKIETTTVLIGPVTSGALSKLGPETSAGCNEVAAAWLDDHHPAPDQNEANEREEAPTAEERIHKLRRKLHVLSARATAPLHMLLPEQNAKMRNCLEARTVRDAWRADRCLARYLKVGSFDSVVARDDVVLRALLEELASRRETELLIAVVSEQDSAYGRLLDDVLEEVVHAERERLGGRPETRFRIREYGYLAGVDGEMPPGALGSDRGFGDGTAGESRNTPSEVGRPWRSPRGGIRRSTTRLRSAAGRPHRA